MAHRAVLTARQRAALFHLPTDEALILRHYALSDEDIDFIRTRRRPENLIGFALQLCALRYPGRLLRPGEIIPKEMSDFIAAQLGVKPDDLLHYAERENTRHEHLEVPRKDNTSASLASIC
jgi:TnpA family transposase